MNENAILCFSHYFVYRRAPKKNFCIFFWILAMTLDELSAIQQIHPEVQALQTQKLEL